MSSDIKTNAARMFRKFAGNQEHHYTADFTNIAIGDGGKLIPRYQKVEGPATLDDFIAHLEGRQGLLVIPVTKGGACWWGSIDIDEYKEDPRRYWRAIARHRLPLVVELSKSAGVHLSHYSRHPQSAYDMRAKLSDWSALLPYNIDQIFPAQSHLGAGDTGTGINIPYFGGDNAKNCAIDRDGNRLSVSAWLDLIEQMPSQPAADTPGQVDVEAAANLLAQHWTEGQRDNLNMAAAGALLNAGIEALQIQEILDAAASIAADTEQRKTAEQIEQAKADGKRIPGFPTLVEIIGPEDARELLQLCGAKQQPDPVPFEIVPMPEQWAIEAPPPVVFAVAPLFPVQTVTVIAAEGGTGKTGFGLAAALSVATGREFFGLPVRQGIAVYLALEENNNSLWRRLHTLIAAQVRRMQDDGLSPEAIEQFHIARRLNLHPAAAVGVELHLITSMRGGDVSMNVPLVDRLIEKMPAEPVLIVLDPLARMHGSEENTNHVNTALVNAAERIAQHTGAAVVFMHHVPKAAITARDVSMNAARGGSALIAAARSSIRLAPVTQQFANVPPEVIAAGDLIEVIHNKLNDGKKCAPFFLRRQAFAFELFTPQTASGSSAGLHHQWLAALWAWWVANGRKGLSLNAVVDARAQVFYPHDDIGRDPARGVIRRAIDDGDLIESDQNAPRSTQRLLIFRGDFDGSM